VKPADAHVNVDDDEGRAVGEVIGQLVEVAAR